MWSWRARRAGRSVGSEVTMNRIHIRSIPKHHSINKQNRKLIKLNCRGVYVGVSGPDGVKIERYDETRWAIGVKRIWLQKKSIDNLLIGNVLECESVRKAQIKTGGLLKLLDHLLAILVDIRIVIQISQNVFAILHRRFHHFTRARKDVGSYEKVYEKHEE